MTTKQYNGVENLLTPDNHALASLTTSTRSSCL